MGVLNVHEKEINKMIRECLEDIGNAVGLVFNKESEEPFLMSKEGQYLKMVLLSSLSKKVAEDIGKQILEEDKEMTEASLNKIQNQANNLIEQTANSFFVELKNK